ncbi:hypothetical protein ABZ484_32515, partial [Streptomyces sp. NPDC006393]|uniref:hypothetical protein n=1 Tax=Streptomyces sp. NPDC006393 TaxID=3156763 RepID=UPI0033F94252
MGTVERHERAADSGGEPPTVARQAPEVRDRDIPTVGSARKGTYGPTAGAGAGEPAEQPRYKPLWIEEPARRRRLPDPVRTAAVRAVLIIAVTLVQAVVAFLFTLAGSWLAFPMVLGGVAGTVVATWAALDVWVTRQVWNQRYGVVSAPSSTARRSHHAGPDGSHPARHPRGDPRLGGARP